MFTQSDTVQFKLPDWITDYISGVDCLTDVHERMSFVIGAAKRNVEEKTGGPFAAGIFEIASGKLVSLGVNLVTSQGLSILHAEMVAISLAQKKLASYDLGGEGLPRHEIVTSTEPCAMCFGAIPWSGVSRVVTGARDEDARRIGFDEGPKLADWQGALAERQIEVIHDMNREQARKVLDEYLQNGGKIYNARDSA